MNGRLCGIGLGLSLWLAGGSLLAVSLEEVKNPRHPAVAALKRFARIGDPGETILLLRGTFSGKRASQITRVVRDLQEDVKRRFLKNRDKSGLRPVDLCLFGDSAGYRKFTRRVIGNDSYQRDRGFFVPYRRLVVADISGGLGPLRHELVHVLLRDDLGTLPDWLDEGIASLYVSVKPGERGLTFLSDHRLGELRSARRAGRLPTLENLASVDDRHFYGPKWADYYAYSRFLLLYLDHQAKLERFVTSICSGPRSRAWQLALLKEFVDIQAFWDWVDGL